MTPKFVYPAQNSPLSSGPIYPIAYLAFLLNVSKLYKAQLSKTKTSTACPNPGPLLLFHILMNDSSMDLIAQARILTVILNL